MVFIKKVVNANPGDADHVGGNDWDKLDDYHDDIDITGPAKINTETRIRSGKKKTMNPANTFGYVEKGSAIVADRDVTEPLLTGNDIRVYEAFAQPLTNKTIDAQTNVVKNRNYTYLVWKDGSTYYAQKGDTGVVTSNSDFKTLIQAIIDTIGTRDATVFTKIKLAPGSYVIATELLISDKYNIHFEGSGAGITILETNTTSTTRMIEIVGTVSGTGKNLTVNGTLKSYTVTMSTADSANFNAGDWVLIRSTALYVAGGSAKQGEIKQLDDVNTGTGVLTFTTPLMDSYTTANTSNVIKINFSRNISFSDLTITKNASYAGTGRWLRMTLVDGFRLNNVELKNATNQFDSGIVINSCIHGIISNCNLTMDEDITTNEQYGIAIQNCSQNIVVTNCTSKGRYRHPFEAANNKGGTDQEGICRGIVFHGCVGSDCHEAVFDTHEDGEGIQFIGCHVLGKRLSYGIQNRSARSKISDCYITGTKIDGINMFANATETDITGCTIIDSGQSGIRIQGNDKVRIDGCTIKNSTDNGILLDTGSEFTMITNNLIIDNDQDGIKCTNIDNSVFVGNIIKDNGQHGIDFEASTCSDNVLANNIFTGNTSGSINNQNQLGNNILRGVAIDNPYPTAGTAATTLRTGFWTAATTTNAIGILNNGVTAVGTGSSQRSTTEGFLQQFATGAVANNNAGLRWATQLFRREWGFYGIVRIVPSSTSDIRCFVGLSSDMAEIAGETTLNNFSGVGVGKRTGDTNWFTYRNDGDATEDRVDTGIAFAASAVTIELTLNSTDFRARIGGVEQTAQTTELPAAATDLALHVEIETGAGAADKTIQILPIFVRSGF